MGDLTPVAFDIETTGLGTDAAITVAGFAHEPGVSVILNADGRDADRARLTEALKQRVSTPVSLTICTNERELLDAVAESADQLNEDRHYLCAYNGETWNGGFDLPFLRSRCVACGCSWPFAGLAYADILDVVDRFKTDEVSDLEGVYDILVGESTCDPFDGSGEAVAAFEAGNWVPLLLHNIADIRRTRELALLAERYVPTSDFDMKNLDPPTS
jgi:hypothetical protein